MKSRPVRWSEAAKEAQEAVAHLETAVESLIEIQEEYKEWRDNLPESLEDSVVAEKLDAVIDLEFDFLQEAQEAIRKLLRR